MASPSGQRAAGDAALVAYCRGGFEAECRRDLELLAQATGGNPLDESAGVPGFVALLLRKPIAPAQVTAALKQHPPIFARELAIATGPHPLDDRDRIAPILALAARAGKQFGSLWLEHPDTNEGKMLSSMCRRLDPLLRAALREAQLLTPDDHPRLPRLHVFFVARSDAWIGTSVPGWNSNWPMGIPRLRMPKDAPSRSTLKLAEAWDTFLTDDERMHLLRPGIRAVDLGAAPGGWSWQFAQRGVRVTAVDNGDLKGEVARDSLVEHVRADGLHFRPRRPVEWMVCDIVEKPSRIAMLVAQWMAGGDCRRTIFNLKLPMKKRYDEVERCRTIIKDAMAKARVGYTLAIRQLYHDREEVTGYCVRTE